MNGWHSFIECESVLDGWLSEASADMDWLTCKHMFTERCCCWLNRFKTVSGDSLLHDYRTTNLFLNLWKYLYSHNLGNIGIDKTQNPVKELSPGPEMFFYLCEIQNRLYSPSWGKR